MFKHIEIYFLIGNGLSFGKIAFPIYYINI